ncbi:MAG: ATP-binding protein [Paludibacteraceae bacterium]|nr:ATP-binding protein [Paludibacteraceae bacterium]
MQLIGRTNEKALLQSYVDSQQAEFIAMYGRRRVGKTFLISNIFADMIVFETSGIIHGSSEDQFAAFNHSLRKIGYTGLYANTWMDAFFALEQTLTPKIKEDQRQVIFIDELPCLDVRSTRFVVALGHFWNSWVSKHNNLILIVCGSATSWMVDNIVNNHGGLHNRITHTMHLHPFNLAQCEEYFQARGMVWDRQSIMQAYMVFGGVPYYLSLIKSSESVAEAIDRLLFTAQGELCEEYYRLFSSLFTNPEPYMTIVGALANHRYGLTRDELAEHLGKSDGGGLTKLLDNLEKCDFICYHRVRLKKINKTGGYYVLSDSFVQFYHTYLDTPSNDEHYWSHNLLSPKTNTFFGLAFERVCMSHILQIKKAIGIDQIGTEYYSWRSTDKEQKAQIDLLIERADRIINLCEIKYSNLPYTITKDADLKFRTRQAAFVNQTGIRFGIQATYISPYGLTPNTYSSSIQKVITMDDLFEY